MDRRYGETHTAATACTLANSSPTRKTMTAANLPPVTLILGGARSGKSSYAERLAEAREGPCVYLATAAAGDAEMAARIALHRERRGPRWTTHEEPLALAGALAAVARPGTVTVVDCLTLWLSNVMHAELHVENECEQLCAALSRLPGPVVLVSNEVGLGIVPDNALARRFRDAAGRLNQSVAAVADRVVFVAAGLPLVLKDA
jgi:adenosylcobinamide kinase/adenosylcobinamide-phosphate guanylyltransferase